MKRIFLLAFAMMICLTLPASAHKGRTDANGGHYDHSTGEYHYHHGYLAHQHVNGICPYNFDDKTNHDSGGGSSSSTSTTSAQSDIPHSSYNQPVSIDLEMILGIALFCCLAFSAIFAVSSDIYSYYRGRKQKEQKRIEKEQKLERDYQIAVKNALRLEAENNQLKEDIKTLQEENVALLDKVYVLLAKMNHPIETIAQTQHNRSLPPHHIDQEEVGFVCGVEFEQEIQKASFEEMLSGQSLLSIAGAPPWVEIGPDGLPRHMGFSEDWGPHFTYYVAQKGSCFHCKRGCSGAYTPIHLLKVRKLTPCSRCNPKPIPIDWYDEYLRLKAIKDRYGIK